MTWRLLAALVVAGALMAGDARPGSAQTPSPSLPYDDVVGPDWRHEPSRGGLGIDGGLDVVFYAGPAGGVIRILDGQVGPSFGERDFTELTRSLDEAASGLRPQSDLLPAPQVPDCELAHTIEGIDLLIDEAVGVTACLGEDGRLLVVAIYGAWDDPATERTEDLRFGAASQSLVARLIAT